MSKKAIWIKDQKILNRFNHFKIDNGGSPDEAVTKLLDIADDKQCQLLLR